MSSAPSAHPMVKLTVTVATLRATASGGRRSHHYWVTSNASTTMYVPVEAGFCWPVTSIVSV